MTAAGFPDFSNSRGAFGGMFEYEDYSNRPSSMPCEMVPSGSQDRALASGSKVVDLIKGHEGLPYNLDLIPPAGLNDDEIDDWKTHVSAL